MRLRPILTIAVLFVLSCSSCTYKTKASSETLDKAEKLIASNPDSAHLLIESMRIENIHAEKIRARQSLLLSIILDKKHIDLQTDSIIAPALHYYSRQGNSKETAATYYYTARIHENAGDLENCMRYLVKAENTQNHEDLYLRAMIHSAKGRIYNQLHEYDMASHEFRKAADYSRIDEDYNRFISNKIREASCRYMMKDHSSARTALDEIYINEETLTENVLAKYYQLAINLADINQEDNISHLIQEYQEKVRKPNIDWLLIARVEMNMGNLQAAETAIEQQRTYRGKDAAYHLIKSKLLEARGNHKDAFTEYKRYVDLCEIIGNSIIDQDTKFVEERESYIEKHERARMKNHVLTLSCIAILLALALTTSIIMTIRKELLLKKHEQIELMRQLEDLISEREELARLNTENDEARRIISERLRIIDNFVFSNVLQDEIFEKQAVENLKQIIENREEFIHHNRLIFNQSYPQFISYLKGHDLTEKEIEHCCLYAIGLNGKMVTAFTNLKRHYHIGSSVRKKLGLSGHDTNISIHIKHLLQELKE